MTSTVSTTPLGTILTFALVLLAGCQGGTTSQEEPGNKSTSKNRSTDSLPPDVSQQVTLEVTGMS